MIVGHTRARQQLEAQLPGAALLQGPPSIGKWTLTHHLAAHHQVLPADRLVIPDRMIINTVRDMRRFASTAPFGTFKLIQARLDNATGEALNALLKLLEEPPPSLRFLLVAAEPVPDTIRSRCMVHHLGLLTDAQATTVLTRRGFTPAKAARAVAMTGGQIRPALAIDTSVAGRGVVLAVVQALATRDRELFVKAIAGFDNTTGELFCRWLTEAITGRWRAFSAGDESGMTFERLMAISTAVSRIRSAKTRLAMRAALEPLTNR